MIWKDLTTPSTSPLNILEDRAPTLGFTVGYPHITLFELITAPEAGLGLITAVVARVRADVESGVVQVAEPIQNALGHYRAILRAAIKEEIEGLPIERIKELGKNVQSLLNEISKRERAAITYVEFDEIFNGFTKKERDFLLAHTVVAQLTIGCSLGCPPCNFNAPIAPRRHLSWDAATRIIDGLGEDFCLHETGYYYSSDPLDWSHDDKTYADILADTAQKYGCTPETTTAIPKGKEELFLELWDAGYWLRLSLSEVNIPRLLEKGIISGTTPNQWRSSLLNRPGCRRNSVYVGSGDRNSLLFEVGKEYDHRSFRPSIGCVNGVYLTPDGTFQFASAATTPLTPNGYHLERITPGFESVIERTYNFGASISTIQPISRVRPDGSRSDGTFELYQVVQGITEAVAVAFQWSTAESKREYWRALDVSVQNSELNYKRDTALTETLQLPRTLVESSFERKLAMISYEWSQHVLPLLSHVRSAITDISVPSVLVNEVDGRWSVDEYFLRAATTVLMTLRERLSIVAGRSYKNGFTSDASSDPLFGSAFNSALERDKCLAKLETIEGTLAALDQSIMLRMARLTRGQAPSILGNTLSQYAKALAVDPRAMLIVTDMLNRIISPAFQGEVAAPLEDRLRAVGQHILRNKHHEYRFSPLPWFDQKNTTDIEERWRAACICSYLNPQYVHAALERSDGSLPTLARLKGWYSDIT